MGVNDALSKNINIDHTQKIIKKSYSLENTQPIQQSNNTMQDDLIALMDEHNKVLSLIFVSEIIQHGIIKFEQEVIEVMRSTDSLHKTALRFSEYFNKNKDLMTDTLNAIKANGYLMSVTQPNEHKSTNTTILSVLREVGDKTDTIATYLVKRMNGGCGVEYKIEII